MYFQRRYLQQDKSFDSTSGLDVIELPQKGILSCIEFKVTATAGSTGCDRDVSPLDALKTVELIVNGSQVVKSLTGRQLKALMFYQGMGQGQAFWTNYADHANEVLITINLGRFYHDLDYMLDLGRVNDPELRIDYDFTLTSHDGWTNGEAQSSPKRDVVCHLLRESTIVPKGYIKTQEVSRFYYASGKTDNLRVPRGPRYSNLYVESYYASSGLTATLSKLTVNINNGEKLPLEMAQGELLHEIAKQYGLFEAEELRGHNYADLIPAILEYGNVLAQIWGETQGVLYSHGALWGQQLGIGGYAHDGAGIGGTCLKTLIRYKGLLPFSVAPIPLFDPRDERTWIDTAELGDFWVTYECDTMGNTSCPIKLLGDSVVTRY